MEALGRVELPTNGLGNVGEGLHLSRIKHLQGGFRCLSWEKSCHSALNCQRICQREWQPCIVLLGTWGTLRERKQARTQFQDARRLTAWRDSADSPKSA